MALPPFRSFGRYINLRVVSCISQGGGPIWTVIRTEQSNAMLLIFKIFPIPNCERELKIRRFKPISPKESHTIHSESNMAATEFCWIHVSDWLLLGRGGIDSILYYTDRHVETDRETLVAPWLRKTPLWREMPAIQLKGSSTPRSPCSKRRLWMDFWEA